MVAPLPDKPAGIPAELTRNPGAWPLPVLAAAAGTVSATEPPTAAGALAARLVTVFVTAGTAPVVIALTAPVTSWTVLAVSAWAAVPEAAVGDVTLGTVSTVTVLTTPVTTGTALAAVD